MPVITGTLTVGQVLSASTGTWARARSGAFTYQWTRGGVAISGATAPTYTLVPADAGTAIRVVVTARNVCGSASATSVASNIP